MKLKDLVSYENSDIYKNNQEKDFNKKEMIKILEEEKDNGIIINLLNMTYGVWIDNFTLKTKPQNSHQFNGLQEVFENIAEKSDDEYFSPIVFYFFNYKNYFQNKKGRNSKRNKIK